MIVFVLNYPWENKFEDLALFTIRPYRSKRLREYCARMSQDHLGVLVDDNVKDVLLAQGFSIDEAPRSVYRVAKLYEALQEYGPGKIRDYESCDATRHGLNLAYSCFARRSGQAPLHVLPFSPETLVKITSNPGGSAGLTNYGVTKAESQTRALERGIQTLKGEKSPEPCLAFSRTQFNDKTRLVWGFPYSMTAIEGLVAYPLIQHFKGGSTPMAFAMPSGALGTRLRVSAYHKRWAYSLDMSQFDATISKKLIHQAFMILRTWFDETEVEKVSGKSVGEVFDLCEGYFIHTPIVMPDSRLYLGKRHGVPSGSYFTQMIDSIVNVIIGGAIAYAYKLYVCRDDIFVLGDDLLMWSNRKVSLDAISTYASNLFHVRLHGSEKSRIFHHTESVHFLGRDWDNGLPTLDQDEILKRMVFPERFRKYSSDPEIRKRQVRMMLLSFAGTYRRAWSIAYSAIDPSNSNIHLGCANTDVNVYYDNVGSRVEEDPDRLSGLMRYLRKYVYSERDRSDIPNTALQYWL